MDFSGKLLKIIIILSVVFILSALAANMLISSLLIFDVQETKMDIKVIEENVVGLNIDTDAIHFGKVQRGAEGIRNITVTNDDSRPHLIQAKAYGNISGFVYMSENNFVLGSHEARNLSVMARPPIDAALGYYDGTLQILFLNIYAR
jgi:hypothetical protein